MKINEVTDRQLNEGPIDFARKVGAGIKGLTQGGLQGAKAGYQAAGAAQAQTAKIKTVANQALQKWAAYNQNIKMSTGADATPDQAVAWLAQFMGQQPRNTKPVGSSPAQIQQWLQKEIAGYMAQQELPQAVAEPLTPADYKGLPEIGNLNKEELLQLKAQLQAA